MDRRIPTKSDRAFLDPVSERRLIGVDETLVQVVRLAASSLPFPVMVVEGLRSSARQRELYAQGRTKPGPKVTWTLYSRHIEGRAVDLAPFISGRIDWADFGRFDSIAGEMFKAAATLGVAIRWGADWDKNGKPRERGETDSPHFELA